MGKKDIKEVIKIAVCDDDKYYVDLVVNAIQKFQETNPNYELIVHSFLKSHDFLSFIMSEEYDIVYLDIKLDDDNGMRIAKTIHKRNPDCLISFMTNYPEYVCDSFIVEAFQYMPKPIEESFFISEIERAIHKMKAIKQKYAFLTSQGYIVLEAKEIYYIKTSYREYTIYSTRGIFTGSISALRDFKRVYPDYDFFKIERSFYVNLYHVKQFNYLSVTLANGDVLTISKNRYKDFKKTITKYLEM